MVDCGAPFHLSTAPSEIAKRISSPPSKMPRANDSDRRLFCMEEKMAEMHDELWELFEFVMRLQRQVEAMKVASKKRGGRGGRSRKSCKGR